MVPSKPQSVVPVLLNTKSKADVCWACGEECVAQFCPACGRVQPPAASNYFSFFGLERRMNLDAAGLQQELYRLSRRLHPDRYARATEREKQWSLEQTSMLNAAFRTLSDPMLRTVYLLQLEGIAIAEQPNVAATARDKVPRELLEEVFELKMLLEQFHGGDHDHALRRELEEAKQVLEQKLQSIGSELQGCWDEWDALIASQPSAAADPEERRRALDRMAAVLHRRSYVDSLLREVAVALSS